MSELISTGITYGVGRTLINNSFSGTAVMNNVILNDGANFSGGTGGGKILSGGTDIFEIFSGSSVNIGNSNLSINSSRELDFNSNQLLYSIGSSGNLKITGNSSSFTQMTMETNTGSGNPTYLNIGNDKIRIVSYSGSNTSEMSIFDDIVLLESYSSGVSSGMKLDCLNITFFDDINKKGVAYKENYHPNYSARTIVDKEYVDNHVLSGNSGSGLYSLEAPTLGSIAVWDFSTHPCNAIVEVKNNFSIILTNMQSGQTATLILKNTTPTSNVVTFTSTITNKVGNNGLSIINTTAGATSVDVATVIFDGFNHYWSIVQNFT